MFLASLALALALAEMVAGTGGRLDAFFLDEGFGTLDPEHLDLAMEGIEQLVTEQSNRLVVVVSHVPEMRMRLEDLVELERSPVSGETSSWRLARLAADLGNGIDQQTSSVAMGAVAPRQRSQKQL